MLAVGMLVANTPITAIRTETPSPIFKDGFPGKRDVAISAKFIQQIYKQISTNGVLLGRTSKITLIHVSELWYLKVWTDSCICAPTAAFHMATWCYLYFKYIQVSMFVTKLWNHPKSTSSLHRTSGFQLPEKATTPQRHCDNRGHDEAHSEGYWRSWSSTAAVGWPWGGSLRSDGVKWWGRKGWRRQRMVEGCKVGCGCGSCDFLLSLHLLFGWKGSVQTTNRKVWLVDTICDNLQSVATTEGETMHMPLVGPKSKLSLERKILVASIWICMKSLGLLPWSSVNDISYFGELWSFGRIRGETFRQLNQSLC